MPFTIIAAEESLTAASVRTELDAIAQDGFTWRNNHFIFSEDWFLIGAYIGGVDLQNMRWNVPEWNIYGRQHLQPTNNDADVPDNLEWIDFRDRPFKLPRNTELALEGVQDNVAAQDSRTVLWIAPPNWSRQRPRGLHRTILRGTTASVTTVANVWTAPAALTLDENPQGGVYAVCGCYAQFLGPFAYRIHFPRMRPTQGRIIYPGGLCQQDTDERPLPLDVPGGEWGRFHTFELPQFSILSHGAAAEVGVVYLDCEYLGDSESLLAV